MNLYSCELFSLFFLFFSFFLSLPYVEERQKNGGFRKKDKDFTESARGGRLSLAATTVCI